MRVPTDLPRRRPRPPRSRVGLIVAASVVFVLLLSLRGIAGFYTDYLWFDEVALTQVWRGVLGAKVALALVFSLVFFVILWVNLAIADRLAPRFRPAGPEEELVERYREIVGDRMGLVRTGAALLFAIIAGVGTSAQWNSWILFNNSEDFGVDDPQFGLDIGFFVFRLPFLSFVFDWAFASLVIILIITAVAHYLNGGIRVQVPAAQRVTPQVKAHLSVLLGVLALLRAADYWLQRYELNFSTRGFVDGAGYTDVKAKLPALELLVIISVAAAALFLVNIRLRGWVLPIIAVGLWGLTSVIVGTLYPLYIQNIRVNPNESAREAPYISRNIEATRTAYKIMPGDNIERRDFDYTEDLDSADLEANAPTIRNVRLWDPDTMRDTYRQLQEVRNFYAFRDVDVDRYTIGNSLTQVMLSVRELNLDGLPSASWENRHVNYTHGYGAVLSPANAVTQNGQPDFIVRDIPPVSEGTFQKIDQPAVYFGEGLGGYAIVNTEREEIDYETDEGTKRSRYEGQGGVRLSGYLRRSAFFLRFGDFNFITSNYLRSNSRVIYKRDIAERVRTAAPFLKFDSDPYPLVLEGRIRWVVDAYTTTSRYPYGQRADTERLPDGSGLRSSFNYVRNSVKVLVDAYDGSMRFYIVDNDDPIVRAYAKAFPALFEPGEPPDDLREHFRYPEDLFRVQSNLYGRYHIDRAQDFFTGGDQWQIARDPGSGPLRTGGDPTSAPAPTTAAGTAAQNTGQPMEPYYLLTRLPGADAESFLILQNYTISRGLLSAFLVAKSDKDEYGRLEVFEMPRGESVNGPNQVNARINQDPVVSSQLTLLNQPSSGSQVIQGNLIVLPIEQSLLYIRPLYVESEATQLPELKKVVVVHGDEVAMGNTLRDALTQIFGDAPETLEQGPSEGEPPAEGEPEPEADLTGDVAALLDRAATKFSEAQAALTAGDLAAYQKAIDEARRLIEQARTLTGPTTTTTPPSPTTTSPGSA